MMHMYAQERRMRKISLPFARADQQQKWGKQMTTSNRQFNRRRIIRKPELLKRVSLSDATVWRKERDGQFPRRVRLGGNSVGWFEDEVDEWLEQLANDREV